MKIFLIFLTFWTFQTESVSIQSPSTSKLDQVPRATVTSRIDLGNEMTVEWEYQEEDNNCIFQATSKSTGWISIGFSDTGTMTDADMIMCGYNSNDGTCYSLDRNAKGSGLIFTDDQQNYKILDCAESNGETWVRFQRKLNTGDEQDYVIENKPTNMIWALGPSDDTNQYHMSRGTVQVNIFNPTL